MAEAALMRGTTVPFSPMENIFPSGLGQARLTTISTSSTWSVNSLVRENGTTDWHIFFTFIPPPAQLSLSFD